MSTVTSERPTRKPRGDKKTELLPASGSASMRIALKSGEWRVMPWTSQGGESGYRLSRDGEEAVFVSDLFPLFRGSPVVLKITADTRTKGEVETLYGLTELDVDPMEYDVGFELVKSDGEKHHIGVSQYGSSCTCGDWIYRRERSEDKALRACKHIRALQGFRLIPSST
jgi:hypothetical protein